MTIEQVQEQIDELKRRDALNEDALLNINARLRALNDDVDELKSWARRIKE
jgi:hypothetical protein